MVLGALLLVEGPPEVRIKLSTALGVTIPFLAVSAFLLHLVLRSRFRPPSVGTSVLVNESGIACTNLVPNGMVRVRGEYWQAVSSAPVSDGARIRVKAVDGLTLHVEPESSNTP